MNINDFTDSDLDSLRRQVLVEQERRANLAAIPDQVAQLAATYMQGGGDVTVLRDVIGTPAD